MIQISKTQKYDCVIYSVSDSANARLWQSFHTTSVFKNVTALQNGGGRLGDYNLQKDI